MLNGAAPAVPKLVATLPGSSPAVQREIYRVLGIIGEDAPGCCTALKQALLAETDRDVFTSQISALIEIIGAQATLPLLTASPGHPHAEIRAEILSRLNWQFAEVPGALSLAAVALSDSDEASGERRPMRSRPSWTSAAASTPRLARRGGTQHYPALYQALHDPATTQVTKPRWRWSRSTTPARWNWIGHQE